MPNRRTKAELQEALADTRDRLREKEDDLANCKKQIKKAGDEIRDYKKKIEFAEEGLQRAQKKLTEKDEQLNQSQQELNEIKRIKQEIHDEKETLVQDLRESEKKTFDRIKEIENELKRSNQQKQILENDNQQLRGKIVELEAKIDTIEKSEVEFPEETHPPKTAFRIDFYQRQGHYHGRIIHLLTKRDRNFTGVDGVSISEFISEYMPVKTAETEEIGEIEEIQPLYPKDKSLEMFEAIKFLQKKRYLDIGESIEAHTPFAVHTRFNLPVVPTKENLDVDTNLFAIRAVAMDNEEKNIIVNSGIADALSSGVVSYEGVIEMPGLDPGEYVLRIHALVPFAKIEETKRIEMNVEPQREKTLLG